MTQEESHSGGTAVEIYTTATDVHTNVTAPAIVTSVTSMVVTEL